MEYQWGTTRRFNAYADYFRKLFGERVQKLTVNAGFTCPNRDGTKGRGGCSFCDNRAFNPSYNETGKPVRQQLDEGIVFHRNRYRKVRKYLAYFQAYSNTYAPLEELKATYQPAMEHPDVVGIVIGTRPDCIDTDKLDYFEKLARERYLVIEYGIESINDATLAAVNRGHTFEVTGKAIVETAARGINVGGHMIIGLPGETREQWIQSAEVLSRLPLHSIKFHQLQLIKGTVMERQYRADPGKFYFFEMEEYLHLMADVVERLNPRLVVERIAGEVNPGTAAREGWGMRYDRVLARFEEILEERDTWQGRLYNETLIFGH
ncbi:MAG: TIGR01212 family radical SAM protein [Bacteroidales bacterium]|nr:TIGR01212 family radical SAM protein [Bacteroidales bacterium]MDT8430551.1 TIGR01212 family radical SAM protein [Bacteroidales bacterium]